MLLSICIFFALFSGIFAAHFEHTNQTLNDLVDQAKSTKSGIFIYFVKNNCTECEYIQHYMSRANLLLNTDPDFEHLFVKVNITANPEDPFIKKFNIKKIPTIYIAGHQRNYTFSKYMGEETTEGFASAMKSTSSYSAIRLYNVDDLMARVNVLMESFVLGVFKSPDSELFKNFLNISTRIPLMRHYYLMGIDLKQNYTNFTQKYPDLHEYVVIIHNPFFTENDTFNQIVVYNETVHSKLEFFIADHFAHWIEICTKQTMILYHAMKIPFLAYRTMVYDDMNTTRKIAQDLKPLALKYYDKIRFCLVNIDKGGLLNQIMGQDIGKIVLFDVNGTIYQGEDMYGKMYDNSDEIGVKVNKMNTWIESFLEGKLVGLNTTELIRQKHNLGKEERKNKQKIDL